MAAVIVLSLIVVGVPVPEDPSTVVLIDRMPYSVPDALPLLNWLSKLISLGAGLSGPSFSSVPLFNSDTRPVREEFALSVPDWTGPFSVRV